MAINIIIDNKKRLRRQIVTGALTKKELWKDLGDLYRSSSFHPNMSSLWDFSNADLTKLAHEDAKEIADFVENNWAPSRKTKSAILAPTSFENLFCNLVAKHLAKHPTVKVRTFKTESDAFSWI